MIINPLAILEPAEQTKLRRRLEALFEKGERLTGAELVEAQTMLTILKEPIGVEEMIHRRTRLRAIKVEIDAQPAKHRTAVDAEAAYRAAFAERSRVIQAADLKLGKARQAAQQARGQVQALQNFMVAAQAECGVSLLLMEFAGAIGVTSMTEASLPAPLIGMVEVELEVEGGTPRMRGYSGPNSRVRADNRVTEGAGVGG